MKKGSRCLLGVVLPLWLGAASTDDLLRARDRQDGATLEKILAELSERAGKNNNDDAAYYQLAVAASYRAQVAIEVGDKARAKDAAEAGIKSAERALALKPDKAEYHRILGTLCGQVIPANVLAGLKYGQCARDSIEKAIKLDPKFSDAYLSRGVGNYYLPSALGGGVELAIRDFRRAIEINPRSAEAHLWLGIALRKARRPAEARHAIATSLSLNPDRVWAKQQLEKTPAQ